MYLLQYPLKPDNETFSSERAHCTIVFDCAGESTEKEIKGQEVHLLVKDLEIGDLTAVFSERVVCRNKSMLHSVYGLEHI